MPEDGRRVALGIRLWKGWREVLHELRLIEGTAEMGMQRGDKGGFSTGHARVGIVGSAGTSARRRLDQWASIHKLFHSQYPQ